MPTVLPCSSNLDWSSVLSENSTCNENVKLIILAVCATLLFSSCLNKGKKELYGNVLLMVGQILVITAL